MLVLALRHAFYQRRSMLKRALTNVNIRNDLYGMAEGWSGDEGGVPRARRRRLSEPSPEVI